MDLNENGFLNYNNIEILESDNDICKVKLNITKNSLNPYNIVHGGLTFSLGDTTMGVMCHKLGKNVVTLNANINYLKPGVGKYLLATSKVIKMGNTTCVLSCDITDDKNNLVATMNGTYYVIGDLWKQ